MAILSATEVSERVHQLDVIEVGVELANLIRRTWDLIGQRPLRTGDPPAHDGQRSRSHEFAVGCVFSQLISSGCLYVMTRPYCHRTRISPCAL